MRNQGRKRILSLIFVLIMIISVLTLLTSCETDNNKIPIPQTKQDVFIYDEDNIIDEDVEKNLNLMLAELKEKTGAEFAVVSIASLMGKDIESYANNLFNTLGIGEKGKDNGVLLLMSRSDTKVRLEIGRGLEGCLNDSKCGRILDDYFVPYRKSDEYSKATDQTVQAVLKVLCEEYEITIDGLDPTKLTIKNDEDDKTVEVILWIVLIFLLLFVLFFVGESGGSSGGYYGGSSGGGFSGGGGFGGGFSGGGGASR